MKILALLASPWKNEPSMGTTSPPTIPSARTSDSQLRFTAFSACQFSVRTLAIVRCPAAGSSTARSAPIAAGFPFQPPRRPDLIDVAVKIELQQIGRIVRRLPHCFCGAIRGGSRASQGRERKQTLSIARTGLSAPHSPQPEQEGDWLAHGSQPDLNGRFVMRRDINQKNRVLAQPRRVVLSRPSASNYACTRRDAAS